MNSRLHLSVCFVVLVVFGSLWDGGCTVRSGAKESAKKGARIHLGAEQPENVLKGLSISGQEKPPYVYAWWEQPFTKKIDGVLYHGWTLYESDIPPKVAIRRRPIPLSEEREREAAKAKILVEVYAHRVKQPQVMLDIRVSCRMAFVLAWDETVVLKNIETGKVLGPDTVLEGPHVDWDSLGFKEGAVLLLTLTPGKYHLQATEK